MPFHLEQTSLCILSRKWKVFGDIKGFNHEEESFLKSRNGEILRHKKSADLRRNQRFIIF